MPLQGSEWSSALPGTQLGDFGRNTSQPGDWALGRTSGKVADLTKLLLLSMPGLL